MAYEARRWREPPSVIQCVCNFCKHNNWNFTCKAFPNGMPDELIDRNEHDTPFPGDNGIRFEVIKGQEEAYLEAKKEIDSFKAYNAELQRRIDEIRAKEAKNKGM